MAVQGKQKGNAYERKVAKELSQWMFNDDNLLRRKGDSGSIKVNVCGDVFPEGQLPPNWKGIFPFMVECKSGYVSEKPNFWKHGQVLKWFLKAIEESKINNQLIIFLICQFKNQQPLLFTNHFFEYYDENDNKILKPTLALPIFDGDKFIYWAYCYFYKHLFEYNFDNLINIDGLINEVIENNEEEKANV